MQIFCKNNLLSWASVDLSEGFQILNRCFLKVLFKLFTEGFFDQKSSKRLFCDDTYHLHVNFSDFQPAHPPPHFWASVSDSAEGGNGPGMSDRGYFSDTIVLSIVGKFFRYYWYFDSKKIALIS